MINLKKMKEKNVINYFTVFKILLLFCEHNYYN